MATTEGRVDPHGHGEPQGHVESHGHSTAAWTGTGVILLSSLLVCLGMIFVWPWLWILGAVGVVAGVVAWIALNKAGHGDPHALKAPPPPTSR